MVKSGVKWMTLVALVGAQPLFLAYFGARAPSPRAHQSSFYLQNPTSILLLCCSLSLDVDIQVWRGSDFDPFWHPLCFLLTETWHFTNRWFFWLQFFCNDVCLLHEHQNTKNHV